MKTEDRTAQRLQRISEEAHVDALLHPDPGGAGLVSLLQAIDRHVSEEESSVEAYRRLARDTPDPVVATVMRLLVEDEERHHRLFQQIGRALEDRLNWAPVQSDCTTTPPDVGWLGRVRAFEADERRGADALRTLAHRAQQAREPLLSHLLQAVAMDSDKHAHLLRFVAQRLASTSRAASQATL
jgi:rubrerythrin